MKIVLLEVRHLNLVPAMASTQCNGCKIVKKSCKCGGQHVIEYVWPCWRCNTLRSLTMLQNPHDTIKVNKSNDVFIVEQVVVIHFWIIETTGFAIYRYGHTKPCALVRSVESVVDFIARC